MERRSSFRFTLFLLVPLAGLGCAATDDLESEDVATADLQVDEGPVDAPGAPPTDAPPRPPEEAFQACQGAAADAACSVTIGERSIDGTCRRGPPGEDALVCVPANLLPMPPPHRRGHRRPPRAAVDACENLASAADCSFEIDGHSIDGTCREGRGGRLACAPPDMPLPGGPPREALSACANLAADATCSFDLGGRTVEGSCWAPPAMAGAPLACAPPEIRDGRMPL